MFTNGDDNNDDDDYDKKGYVQLTFLSKQKWTYTQKKSRVENEIYSNKHRHNNNNNNLREKFSFPANEEEKKEIKC